MFLRKWKLTKKRSNLIHLFVLVLNITYAYQKALKNETETCSVNISKWKGTINNCSVFLIIYTLVIYTYVQPISIDIHQRRYAGEY